MKANNYDLYENNSSFTLHRCCTELLLKRIIHQNLLPCKKIKETCLNKLLFLNFSQFSSRNQLFLIVI